MRQTVNCPIDIARRKPIYNFALDGNALKAIELANQLAPALLQNNKDLNFDLLSLHYVNLVHMRKCTEALEFAQMELTPFGKQDKYVEKLEDCMALLAYEEPEKSPMFHLLSMEYLQNVADSLNRTILAHANLLSYTSLQRLVQQTTVVRQWLHQGLGKLLNNPSHGLWRINMAFELFDKIPQFTWICMQNTESPGMQMNCLTECHKDMSRHKCD